MTRILLIETASPKRVREKAQQILKSSTYPDPEISILCNEKNRDKYKALSGAKVHALAGPPRLGAIKDLPRNRFDIMFAFWTGERKYRSWKLLGLRLRAKKTFIIGGDGNEFRLTWKAVCRHSIFRLQHPLPTDHRCYVENMVENAAENVARNAVDT